MNNDKKLREDMFFLLGQIEAASFPFETGQPYHDLIDSIIEQYKSILKRTVGYEQ